jgi:hypothetical protein
VGIKRSGETQMTETAKRKAKSPYQRYGKIPFRYSDQYRRWRAAVIAHVDKAAIVEASFAHDRYLRERGLKADAPLPPKINYSILG